MHRSEVRALIATAVGAYSPNREITLNVLLQSRQARRSLAAQAAGVGGPVTKKVFFDVKIGDQSAGRIVIGLYGRFGPIVLY